MKKVLLAICALLLILYAFMGCTQVDTQEQKINEILQVNYNDITKIIFFNGRTGQRATVENREKIKKFMGLIDSYVIRKIEGSPEVKPGPAYSAQFYMMGNKVFTLQFLTLKLDSILGINGKEYKVIKTDLTIEKIDNFLKSVE